MKLPRISPELYDRLSKRWQHRDLQDARLPYTYDVSARARYSNEGERLRIEKTVIIGWAREAIQSDPVTRAALRDMGILK